MERFGTAGIRGATQTAVTPSLAVALGRAAADGIETVVVGRDGRTTSPALADALAAGFTSGGASVLRLGQIPTAAVGFASRGRHGAMVTASHNPPGDNGIKLFADGGAIGQEAEAAIERRLDEQRSPVAWDRWGGRRRERMLSRYRRAVVDYARSATGTAPAPDGTVVVDCANGVSARATPQVLRALGVDVTTLNDNVDGHFPGRPSKPTAETLSVLRSMVDADPGAVFGVGHDGDGDRIVIVDEAGEVVHEDTILAILAEHFLARSDAADPVVVTTPNASARIDERVATVGGRVERTPLGQLRRGVESVDGTVVFAGEPWKHCHPELGPWIDGTATAAVLAGLVGAAGGLGPLRDPVTERPYVKRNVECPDDRKGAAMAAVRATAPDRYPAATLETDGYVRLRWPDHSWALVRPSGTEPYLRVYVEAEEAADRAAELVGIVSEAVASAERS
jgi:phosphomannomutase